MGGGRGRPGHRPSPPPTQGLQDCECQQPRQPRAQKTGTWALAGGEGAREGRVVRTPARGSVGPATLGGQPAVVEVGKGTHTRGRTLEAPALPWSLPLITTSSRGSPDSGDRVGDTKALGEVASSFKYPLGQPPCCLDGDHYCFRGTGKGQEPQLGQESRKRHRGSRLGPGPWKAVLTVPLLSPRRRGARSGVRPSPAPQLVLGPHLRQPGGPKVGVGSSLCPLPPSWGPNPVPR